MGQGQPACVHPGGTPSSPALIPRSVGRASGPPQDARLRRAFRWRAAGSRLRWVQGEGGKGRAAAAGEPLARVPRWPPTNCPGKGCGRPGQCSGWRTGCGLRRGSCRLGGAGGGRGRRKATRRCPGPCDSGPRQAHPSRGVSSPPASPPHPTHQQPLSRRGLRTVTPSETTACEGPEALGGHLSAREPRGSKNSLRLGGPRGLLWVQRGDRRGTGCLHCPGGLESGPGAIVLGRKGWPLGQRTCFRRGDPAPEEPPKVWQSVTGCLHVGSLPASWPADHTPTGAASWLPSGGPSLGVGGGSGQASPHMSSLSSAHNLQISHRPTGPILGGHIALPSTWAGPQWGEATPQRQGEACSWAPAEPGLPRGSALKVWSGTDADSKAPGATAGSHSVLPVWPGSAMGDGPPTA